MENLKELVKPFLAKSGSGCDEQPPLTPEAYEQMKADMYNESEGDLHESDGYSCRECRNKGFIAVVQQNEMYGYFSETLIPCRCQRIRSAIHKLNKSGLKNVVKEYTFDKYQTPDKWQAYIKEMAQKFCGDDLHKWFFIGGQSGAGKSHICTAIAVHYIRQGFATHYMLWRDEIVRIKALVTEPEQYARLMTELKTVPVLYIDDLFKVGKNAEGKIAQPTAADVNAAFEIINHRYSDPNLITIISSERTLNELLAIDEATAGRIAERSKDGGYCINLKPDTTRNWRLKGIVEL